MEGEVSRRVDDFFRKSLKKGFVSKEELQKICIECGVFIRDFLDSIQRSSRGSCHSNKGVALGASTFLRAKRHGVSSSANAGAQKSMPEIVGSLANLETLLEEGFLTEAQHHHFQEASKFASNFLEILQLNLSFVLNVNFHLFSKNINFE